MLTELRVGGYRSFRDPQVLALAPITVFVGPNSSGKTALLESVGLIKQMVEAPESQRGVLLRGRYVDVGPFERLAYGHQADRTVRLGFSWEWDGVVTSREDIGVSLWDGLEGLYGPHGLPHVQARSAGIDWDLKQGAAGYPEAAIVGITVHLDNYPWMRLEPARVDIGIEIQESVALSGENLPWWVWFMLKHDEQGTSWLEEYFTEYFADLADRGSVAETIEKSQPNSPDTPFDLWEVLRQHGIDKESVLKSTAAPSDDLYWPKSTPLSVNRWWPVLTFAPRHPFWRLWIQSTAGSRSRIARNLGLFIKFVQQDPSRSKNWWRRDLVKDVEADRRRIRRPRVNDVRGPAIGDLTLDPPLPSIEWHLERGLPRLTGVAPDFRYVLWRPWTTSPFALIAGETFWIEHEWLPFAPVPDIGHAVEAIGESARDLLTGARIFGPHRSPPPPYAPTTAVDPGQEALAFLAPLLINPDRIAVVNAALERLGIAYRVGVASAAPREGPALVGLRYIHRHTGQAFWPSQVGYGIGQIVPLVVGLHEPNPRLFLVQQPELHLHPAAQAALGSLFADAAQQRGHQLLIETHSEHLILRLQRLVRHGQLDAAMVRVYYIDNVDGVSHVQGLRWDSRGEWLDTWPNGFFEEDFLERFGGPV